MPASRRISMCLTVLATFLSVQATAQTPYQNARGSNFDIWCQEHKNLPAARCDQRRPEDEKAYEAYRNKIGGYEETLKLKRQQKEQQDKTFLHNDPVDNGQSRGP